MLEDACTGFSGARPRVDKIQEGKKMKQTLLAASLALAATSATAATIEAPKMDVTVISQSASANGVPQWVVPAVIAGLVILLVLNATGAPVKVIK